MKAADRIEGVITRYHLLTVFLGVFLFFQPFPGHASVREVSFALMLIVFIFKAARHGVRIDFRDPTVIGLGLIVFASVLSSALSPYSFESFDAIRKNLFYHSVVFVVIASEYRSFQELKPVILALIGGFAALSLNILILREPEVLLNWIKATEAKDRLLIGYSLFSIFYIPFGFAWLYSSRENRAFKAGVLFFILLEAVLTFLNNHRTQLVAFGLGVLFVTVFARKYKLVAAILMVSIVLGGVFLKLHPASFERYKTLLTPSTYYSNEYKALNNRLAIWEGTVEMISERPLSGWGYGWKKLSTVARDRFVERWKDRKGVYDYFTSRGYGSANPHNLILQILFEVGILGLLAFLFFWVTVVVKAFTVKATGAGALFLRASVPGVLLSYAIINTTNGLWEEAMGNIMLAFAAISLVLYREVRQKEASGT